MQLDRRTRRDADITTITPGEFFAAQFPRFAERNGALAARGFDALNAPPLTIESGGESWTITANGSTLTADSGTIEGAMIVTLTLEQFSDWVQNQQSFNGMTVARSLVTRQATERDVSVWDALWLTVLEGWPVVDEIDFRDRFGEPLDLGRHFTPDDDPADIAHFLREAGYLHLRGWTDPAEMATIADDIDRARPLYSETDGKSWWATLADGTRSCVRLQEFLGHSPTTVAMLSSDRWDQLRRALAADDDLVQAPVEGRCIEALIKPIGVVAGPSDLTFHRDCHLGRHAYGCSSMTIGVSVTGSDPSNGQLRVIAGSHRVAMPVEIAKTDPYLPLIPFSTEPGDLTVHLSCTLHEATPPVVAERKVMYTGFSMRPPADAGPPANEHLVELRERVHQILKPTTEQ